MIEEQKGTAEAEELVESLGFESLPIKPIDVANSIHCDDFKLVMEYQSFSSEAILGKAEGNSNGALIYINGNIGDSGRLNFTASHEIGHVCMHIMPQSGRRSFQCGSKELNNPYDDPIERQANGFASGLLMPKSLIKKYSEYEINWHNISLISKKCGASLEATYRRFSNLVNEPSVLVIHQNGRFIRFVHSGNFDFFIDKSPLSSHQKSLMTVINDEPFPVDFDTVDASDWINPHYKGITLESVYSSTILLKEGFSYTILTYDDDCILEDDDEFF